MMYNMIIILKETIEYVYYNHIFKKSMEIIYIPLT